MSCLLLLALPVGSGCGIDEAPACTDGQKNGVESDVDCGGSCTTKCQAGKTCVVFEDCMTGVCGADKKCAAASSAYHQPSKLG